MCDNIPIISIAPASAAEDDPKSSYEDQTYYAAELRIKRSLLAFNAAIAILGAVQLALGALIQQYMADEFLSPTALADTGLLHQLPPPLWTTGIVPSVLGFIGFSATICGFSGRSETTKKMTLMWLIFSSFVEVFSYAIFSAFGFYEPSRFRVSIYIFGACSQDDNVCRCLTKDGRHFWSFQQMACESIRKITILYFVVILAIIFGLLCSVTSVVLSFLMTSCAQNYFVQNIDESKLFGGPQSTAYRGSFSHFAPRGSFDRPDLLRSNSYEWNRFRLSIS